jgi:hypothetical protein
MQVRVDDRGHHGRPRQVYAPGAGRDLRIGGGSRLNDRCTVHDEHGIFDRCTPISDDEPRTFEYGDGGS